MNASPSQRLAIGISARALFDLQEEDEVLRSHGREAYRRYQLEQVDNPLPPGAGVPMIRSLVARNDDADRGVEVVVFSEAVADASSRIMASARQHDLEVSRAAFTGGDPLSPYLRAFRVDLFLSSDPEEAAAAMEAGTAAALVRNESREAGGRIRIALEGRAVTAALESVDAEHAEPGQDGVVERLPGMLVPRWIRALCGLQRAGGTESSLVRTALFSGEDNSTNSRILTALRDWEIELDQAFFTGDVSKDDVIAAFGPQIVFDLLRRQKKDVPVASLEESAEERDDSKKKASRPPRPEAAGSFSRLRLRS